MTFAITIAQRKGGAGKTTLACQLASGFIQSGRSVLGIDFDEQQSFAGWAAARRERQEDDPLFHGVILNKMGITAHMRRVKPDVLIIDTPPTIDLSVKRAIASADLVLTPMQLSPIDLQASMPTAEAVGEAGRDVLFVINRAPARARIADEIRRQIIKYNLPVAKTELGNRTAFVESMAGGAGVLETAKTSTAAQELSALMDEVTSRVKGRRKAAA